MRKHIHEEVESMERCLKEASMVEYMRGRRAFPLRAATFAAVRAKLQVNLAILPEQLFEPIQTVRANIMLQLQTVRTDLKLALANLIREGPTTN